MGSTMRIAVAGATGRVGRHVVDVARERGHEVMPMSRTHGVNVVTGVGVAGALRGADAIIDVSTKATPDRAEAEEFFLASSWILHDEGVKAGVGRMVVVSIVGCDRFSDGYLAAVAEHERAAFAGPVPAAVVRATQFHEFVEELAAWGRRGETVSAPPMRTQLVAARTVAESLVDAATDGWDDARGSVIEVAGPREETLADAIGLLLRRRGDRARVEVGLSPAYPEPERLTDGSTLPGPGARLAGPSFAEWLSAEVPAAA